MLREAACVLLGRTGLTVQKGAGLPIWLTGVTNILDALCGDCSQTSLVTPYPLALAILRPSFTIIAVLLED